MTLPAPVLTTWDALHVGDIVQGKDGGLWRVELREKVTGTRWLASGGGGKRADLFRLAILDGSRPAITATRNLSDPAVRVFELDRTTERQALTALSDTFGEVTMISEGDIVSDATDMLQGTADHPSGECQHPGDAVSTLRTGKIVCTACQFVIFDPAMAAYLLGEVPAPPATVVCASSDGVEYLIPADQVADACNAGIHPVGARQFHGERFTGCDACGLIEPAIEPLTVERIAAIFDVPVEMLQPAQIAPTPPAPVAEPVAEPAPVVPAATTVPRQAPPVDQFADPAPHIEVKRDQWGRYVLPHPITGVDQSWTRASTLARCLSDEYQLTGWKLRQVAIGIARNPDLIAGAVAANVDDKGTLDGLVKKAMERAESSSGANLGTALHNFTHRLDRGESLQSLRAPAPLGADLVEYQATLKRHGLTIIPDLIERIVVWPEINAAGTFDRIVSQHVGHWSQCPLTVLDLKTGKSVEYGWLEFAIQQAIYANATHMWNPVTRTYTPLPPRDVLDRDRALILHLPVGKAQGDVYGVNLIEGVEAARAAERVRQYRNSSKGYGWMVQPVAAESLLLHRVSMADGPELSRLWSKHHPAGEWTEAVQAAAADRLARLQVVAQ